MVRDHVLTSRILIKIITGCILIAFLTGCSSEYGTIGPTIEGAKSVTGGAMQVLVGLPGGPGSADGMGASARFNYPRSVVAVGNDLYAADQNNHTIRKIDTLTGNVTTIAGYPGIPGLNDGVGRNVRFNAPEGIETDGTFLYIADTKNHTIRKMEISSGYVGTLAGKRGQSGTSDGTGTNATFWGPSALTLMGDYLYVADTDNNIIRRVSKIDGETTTIAGSSSQQGNSDGYGVGARFHFPLGIANDGNKIYIADTYNHTIRELDPVSGAVVTVAGKAEEPGYKDGAADEARFNNPYGLYVVEGIVLVSDMGNRVIRLIDTANSTVTTITGIPSVAGSEDGQVNTGTFASPADIDIAGDYMYVADLMNNAIRRVELATGKIITLAGKAPHIGFDDGVGEDSRFYTPGGIIKDGDNLYVADTYGNTIRKVNINTGEVVTLAGSPGEPGTADSSESPALFNSPTDIIVDEERENIYIIDTNNSVIRRMNLTTGEVRTFAGYPGKAGYVDAVGIGARFNAPKRGVRIGNIIYMVDTGNNLIRAVNISSGEVTTIAGDSNEAGWRDTDEQSSIKARFNGPGDITTDGTFLYIADTGNHVIRRVDPAAGTVITISGTPGSSGLLDSQFGAPQFKSPEGILWDNGILYISDTENNIIRKLDLSDMSVSFLAGDVSCLEESQVVDGKKSVNLKCTGQPAGTSSFGDSTDGTGRTTSFLTPTSINSDETYLYLTETGYGRIRRINKDTGETHSFSFTKDKGIPLNSPSGGEIAGNFFYITDKGNHIIRKLDITDLNGAPLIIIAGTVGYGGYRKSSGFSAQFRRPVGIAADGKGSLYIADTGNHTIRKIVIDTKEVTTIAGSPGIGGFMDSMFGSPLFNSPRGICFVEDHLYVADSGNHLIRRVNVNTGYVGLVAGLSDYVNNVGSPGTADSTGAAAGFNDPRGITSDGQYLYVTDTGNHTIRRILRATGEVKTIAGMPREAGYNDALGFDARFTFPKGVTVDDNHIYVADSGNNVIRRINKRTGEVLTFSGRQGQSSFITGGREEARYNNIISMTTDRTSPYVYFTDGVENVVGKVSKQ